ncbi:MAG: hypothetical protein VB061_00145 [Christensenella sp.]|nr:hypothetical protein [Christensenella sp.]
MICQPFLGAIELNSLQAGGKIRFEIPLLFLVGNPIVGINNLKNCVQLLFWSEQSFGDMDIKSIKKRKMVVVLYADAIRPVDMFPQTCHMETVVAMTRT